MIALGCPQIARLGHKIKKKHTLGEDRSRTLVDPFKNSWIRPCYFQTLV